MNTPIATETRCAGSLHRLVRGHLRATLYLGDCLDVLPEISGVDAVITDPPYGMGLDTNYGQFGGTDYNGLKGGGRVWKRIEGDSQQFDPRPWMLGKVQVFWGAQYYCHALPQKGGWMVFNKRGDGKPSEICFGDCELAWCNVGQAVRMFSFMWHGVARWGKEEQIHPSQKPAALMAWAMEKSKVPIGATVLDPYMGSGSTGIACLRTGRHFIGIEKDPDYFKAACARLESECNQGAFDMTPNDQADL